MGLSKKQRLEKQRKHRLKRMAKAKIPLYQPESVSKPWKVPDLGQNVVSAAVRRLCSQIQRACALAAWLALLPFMTAGCALSYTLESIVAPFDAVGNGLVTLAHWMFVGIWERDTDRVEPEWTRRVVKLEKELVKLRKEVKRLRKSASTAAPAGAQAPMPTVMVQKMTALPIPLPIAVAPPPPPPMRMPPPPPPATPSRLTFKKPNAPTAVKKTATTTNGPISLATLLSAKGGLRKGEQRAAGVAPRKGMPAISLSDISSVQLKKAVRRGDENAPVNKKPSAAMVVHLRKTQIQRSPGGTPMRPPGLVESSDCSANIISSALRTKFKSLRVKSPRSASPAGSDTDEPYMSPYKPRSRLLVR